MSSELKVNKITPESGTTLTLGDSGDSVAFATGAFPALANLTVSGDLTVDTNSLKVDSTNNRVGIGKTNPSTALDVVGTTTATLFAGSGASLTTLNANELDSGTVPDARFPATLPAISGANLTNLDAADLASGTVPTARLGSGTASSTTFLAGDSSFKTITGTTINNNADDRVITGSGSANTLNGEASLTFDGTTIYVNSAASGNTLHTLLKLETDGAADGSGITIDTRTADTKGQIDFLDGPGSYDGNYVFKVGTGSQLATPTERLRVNPTGIDVTGAITVNGSAFASGMSLFDVQVITSTSTYTPTSGTKFVRVYATGGGSGAGGIASDQYNEFWGNGGNGGNTGVKTYTASELGSTAAISIGSGGSGGSGNANGSHGGSTTFDPAGSGATLTGNGGYGGYGQGVDGIGSSYPDYNNLTGNADYVIYGEFPSGNVGRRSISTDKFYNLSAAGGRSAFGRGGNGYVSTAANFSHIGTAGTLGGGGGGAMAIASQGNYAGGAGGSGLVVIEEYK
jgi:hypothetical protein